jgi:hypothetical protein
MSASSPESQVSSMAQSGYTHAASDAKWQDFLFHKITLLFAALVAFFSPKWKDTFYQKIQTLPSFTWIIWVLLTLQIIVQFKDDLVQPFIYFQF